VVAALAAAAALLYFVRLGVPDLALWDEILYATRAISIGHESGWLDQREGSVGGLWTGAHPPLVIWQMAILSRLFGPSEWALRAPAALAGIGCVVVLYLFARRLARDSTVALLSALVLLLTPTFTQYARRAQLDVPVLLWILACLYCAWRGLSGGARWFVGSGLALGLGLMSKVMAAFLAPLILGAYLVTEAVAGSPPRARRGLWGLALLGVLGVAVAAPWHLFITVKLGSPYWSEALGYHVFSRVATALEGHSSSLGVLYWPHQIILRLGVFFPFVLLGLSRRAAESVLGNEARRFLLCWFFVPFGAFTLVATKFYPYLLLFLLPLVVFAALGIRMVLRGLVSPSLAGRLAAGSVACLLWSESPALHRNLESIASSASQGRFPSPAELGPVAAFALATSAALVLAGLAASALPEPRRRAWLNITLAVAVAAPALVLAVSPVVRGHASWRELRSELRRISPDRVVLFCGDPVVGRYHLRVANEAGRPEWTIAPLDSARPSLETLAQTAVRTTGCIAVERTGAGTAFDPGSVFEERWRNRRFVLFERAGGS
jgi:4-amino-4-deoxy-L-arabinose transferase-like glycosyltransferase